MKTSGGAELVNAAYGSAPLADPGIVAYAQRWAERANELMDQWDLGGCFVDDIQRNYISGIAGGAVCAKYPGQSNAPIPAWEAAIASFCNTVYDYLHARGKFVIWNAQAYIGGYAPSDTAQSSLEWWPSIVDNCDGIMDEYWLATPGWPPTTPRRSSTGWLDALRKPAYLQSKGKFLCCVTYSGLTVANAQYTILSMLLENKGTLFGDGMWPNEWIPIYDRLLTLGDAQGAKSQNGNRWQRQYEHGLVWVDPVAGTAGIS
jgi:regulator of sigma D